MGGYATGGAGFFSHPIDAVSSFVQEAWSGNLSDIDKQTIINNGSEAIAMASAGNDPAIVRSAQDAMLADINSALDSFSIKGDSGGAQPSNDLRLPGGLTLSPATLEWMAIGVAVLIIGAIVFPYAAPLIIGNVKAGKAISKA